MNKVRLCASLLIAAFGSNPFRRDFWRRLGKAVKLWFGGLKEGGKVSDEIYEKRIAACRQCPISFQKFGLLTCGSPLVKELRDKGCFCDMVTAARLTEKTCWLDTETDLDFGWRRVFGSAQTSAPPPDENPPPSDAENKPTATLSLVNPPVYVGTAGSKTPE